MEKWKIEPEALEIIATEARGSIRDALVRLDAAYDYAAGAEKITATHAQESIDYG